MEFSEFRITSSSQDRPLQRMHTGSKRRRGRGRRPAGEGMLLAVGVCAVALLMLLYFELFQLHDSGEGVIAASAPTASPEEEELGRLRFVSGTIESIYSARPRLSLPVTAGDMELLNADQILKMTVEPGETVRAAASGVVGEIGIHRDYGNYVSITHGGGLASVYYHLAQIRVESGQPLQAEDTLGAVGEDGVLYLAILQDDAAQEVARYFDAFAGRS